MVYTIKNIINEIELPRGRYVKYFFSNLTRKKEFCMLFKLY